MNKLKVLELFAGIGACSKALERLGIEHEIVDAVEIDKYAIKSFNAIHNTNFEPQDICNWNKNIDVDLIFHGSPCQDFSLAGKQAGGDEGSGTRSSLMYETIRIVEKLKPKYVIWENVKNLLSKKHRHNFDAYLQTMEALGYKNYYQVLNAKDYGIPQNRERVFTISILTDVDYLFIFPPKQELKLKLKDMLENEVDEKYYLSEKMINYISSTGTANFKNPDSKINLDIARPITTDQNKRAGTTNYLSNELPENYDLKNAYLRNFGSKGKLQEKEVCDTLTASMGTGGGNVPILKIKNATNKGYLEATDGDSVNLAYPESETRRGRVGKEVSQTLQCNDSMGVVVDKSSVKQNLKIRKLTPREVWRLMGFDDIDFDKASKVNSNAQLYKQAGNSIVVNVLETIFKELF